MAVVISSVEQPFPIYQTTVAGKITGSEPQQGQFKINIDFLQSSAMPASQYHCSYRFRKKQDLQKLLSSLISLSFEAGLSASVRYSVPISVAFKHNILPKSQPGALTKVFQPPDFCVCLSSL